MAKYLAYNIKTKQIHSNELSLGARVTIAEMDELGFPASEGWRTTSKSKLFKDKTIMSDFHQMTNGLPKPWYRALKDSNGIVLGLITKTKVYHYGKLNKAHLVQYCPQLVEESVLNDLDFVRLYNSELE